MNTNSDELRPRRIGQLVVSAFALMCFNTIGCKSLTHPVPINGSIRTIELNVGMDFDQAIDLLNSSGADSPKVLKLLSRDLGYYRGRFGRFRLPTGAVIQIFGKPMEGTEKQTIWMIVVSNYVPKKIDWDNPKDPGLLELMESSVRVENFTFNSSGNQ